MSLQLHRPDGKGGLEVRAGTEQNYRSTLRSPRWGAALRGGRLPELANPEMNPTSTARSVAFWVVLGAITFGLIVAGYASGLWSLGGG
ncbi:MAG: hypothetical protein WAK98_17175 [Gemmobacter sp.]|jgi:hypothetical protein|nr:hypothetical protein [Chloroflexota bacterium]